MNFLYSIDAAIFLFLNKTVANPVFDFLMPVVTESDNWTIPLALIILALLLFGGKKGRIAVLLVALIVTLSDQLSSHVIKPWIGRVRPCFVVEGVRQLIRQSHSFSFPSSHASNMAAVATLFSIKYPKIKWVVIGIAILVGYSRIYVGVHYPFDVLAGFILGICCALVIIQCEKWVITIYKNAKQKQTPQES